MAWWWVNQKQSYAEERKFGILWAPYFSSDGKKRVHWDSMDRLTPGDVVLHYSHGKIVSYSVVTEGAIPSNRPASLSADLWGTDGRLVRTSYVDAHRPVLREELAVDWRRSEPREGPFQVDLGVKLGYLFPLSDEFARHFAAKFGERFATALAAGTHLPTGGKRAASAPPAAEPSADDGADAFDGELEIATTGMARGEQKFLRASLFGAKSHDSCALCGQEFPIRFLWAAHIKKRSACTPDERRDTSNVAMAACVFGCDSLYEAGLITVAANGRIMATLADTTPAIRRYTDEIEGLTCLAFNDTSAKYFQWHRENIWHG